MPVKKAVLIGCNYPGTSAELKGCINDVLSVQEMLTTYYGFTPADITVMIDTDQSAQQPTGHNIKAVLGAMVKAANDGDILFVHYSGHGTQVPSANPDEADGKDEAICPCDMNVMTDDDLRVIFMPLKDKKDVKLTFIADCCHSGTLLDHKQIVITGPKEGGPPPPNIDVQAIQSMLAMLGGGKKELDGELIKNRALPYSDLCNMLFTVATKYMSGGKAGGAGGSAGGVGGLASGLAGQLLGGADGKKGPLGQVDFHKTMLALFGDDASAGSQRNAQLLQLVSMGASMMGAGGLANALGGAQGGAKPAGQGGAAGGGGGGGGFLGSLLGMCCAGGSATQTGHAGSGPGAAYAAPAQGQQQGAVPPPPGAVPGGPSELPEDVGILITGCQDTETSADARPPGGPAHGALTNALVTVVKGHHEGGRSDPLTYRNLVIGVREALAKTGFAQNPCLECGNKWADSPFVVTA